MLPTSNSKFLSDEDLLLYGRGTKAVGIRTTNSKFVGGIRKRRDTHEIRGQNQVRYLNRLAMAAQERIII